MTFIAIITKKKRESLLADIALSFITLYKVHNNITTASVVTAQPIDAALKKDFIKFIKSSDDKGVELKELVDEKIIGGAIIRVGDQQIDASVIRTIKELKKTYNKNLYIKDF
jgi:F-type H+-transporting ATPase subunit delta